MKPKARFIQSIIATAQQNQIEMPWAQGSRRISLATNRQNQIDLRQVKTA